MNEKTIFVYENAIGPVTFAIDSPFWIRDITGISGLEVELSESSSSKQIGTTIAQQKVRGRPITIDGSIFEPLENTRKQLLDVIAPYLNATLTIHENGEAWYVDVVPTNTPEITPGNGEQQFQLQLYAAHPYWRSSCEIKSMVTGLIPLFKFPFIVRKKWYVSRYTAEHFKEIINYGNVPVEFKIVFLAQRTIINPEIYHVESEKTIRLNMTLKPNEQVVISTVEGSRGVVFVDGAKNTSNGFRFLSVISDLSMALLPGKNTFKADAANTKKGLGITIYHHKGERSGV